MEKIRCDLLVIGAGSGGLSVAAGGVQMGASVALFERGKMGGDCLNYGCVPSKALLAAGHAAAHYGHTSQFGVNGSGAEIDFAAVNDHVHGVIAGIAPHDSVERFEDLGVDVIQEGAKFTGPREVVGEGGTRVRARRFIIATGSSPAVPPIPGLDQVQFLTNETVFDLRERPDHLIVVGGGPIGLEMAQAHRRLGAKVTVLEAFRIMGPDDRDLVAVVRARLDAFAKEVGIPMQALCATQKGEKDPKNYRKPKSGMWAHFDSSLNGSVSPDLPTCFYVGDAAGREGDHSDSDKGFAVAVGVKGVECHVDRVVGPRGIVAAPIPHSDSHP